MRVSSDAFEILPGLVPADRTSVLYIVPCAGHSLKELGVFTLYYRAHENFLRDGRITPDTEKHPLPSWREEDGRLVIEGFFAGEQEHSIDLIRPGSESRPEVLAAFRIYSLKEDFHGLKPYRGNFHQHSTNSRCCHAPEDTPAHVAAESRRIGLDFTTISDHSYYDSVREAEAVYADVPLDLALFPGEEVHPMQWSQHIVNFGGRHSITGANFTTAYSGRTYSTSELGGRLLSIGRSQNEGQYYMPVSFSIKNASDLIPGAFAEIWLLCGEKDNVITVPVSALTEEQGLYFVYLKLDGQCYRKQEVTPGASDGQRTEILKGLATGDNVVIKGAYNVKLASASNAIPAHTHNH